jgi:hypothetical protein
LRERSRYLNIAATGAEPALPYVVGDTFRLRAGARRYQLVGYDSGGACDSLLRSPGGRYLIYGTSRDGWPALELLDLMTGARSTFRTHACDPAWGEGDRIAYVHDVRFNSATGEYTARITVQQGLDGTPSAWTAGGAWTNLIWAGAHLLAGRNVGFYPGPLVILAGPRRQRIVDRGPGKLGPFLRVVALNPKGNEALLDAQRLGPRGGGPGSLDLAMLLRISDGKLLSTARVNRDEARDGELAALAADGSWQRSQIITTDGYFVGGSAHPPAALVTLTVAGDRVRLRSVKPLIDHGYPLDGQDLDQVSQARFLDAGGQHIAVWFDGAGQVEYLECDTVSKRCTSSATYGGPNAPGATFVSNPSRP